MNKIAKRCKNIYDNNIKVLERYYPDLAKRVKNVKDSGQYKIVPNSDNKTFNLYNTKLEEYYYSAKNPLYNVKQELDKLELKNTRLAIFLGFGLGYEVIYFLLNIAEKQKTERIIIIEKDIEIFTLALYANDFTSMLKNNNIILLVGIEEEELFVKIRDKITTKIVTLSRSVNLINYSASLNWFNEYYIYAVKSYKEATINSLNSIGDFPEDALWGVQNMFKNLNEIVSHPGINMLFNKFKNKPAVVVASGPSLKKNIHLLKDIKDKAIIICAESTLRALIKHGIKPHMVATLERTIMTKDSFVDFEYEDIKDVYMAACPVIPKEAYEVYKGPRFVVYRSFDHFKWLGIDKGMLRIKESAANMAFKIADSLGCDPIVLIGQDLAFSRDNDSTHIDEAQGGGNQEQYHQNKIIEVMGNDGKTIKTSYWWHKFLQSYEIDVAEYKGKCINATEGGAYIKGTEVMTFGEAIDKYIQEPFYPLKKIREYTFEFSNYDIENNYKDIMNKIKSSKDDLYKIIDYCKEGVNKWGKYKDVLKEYTEKNSVTEEEEKKLEEMGLEITNPRKELTSFSDTFQLLLMHIVQPLYIHFDMNMNSLYGEYNLREAATARALMYYQKWYAHINNAAIIVLEELLTAEERLKKILENKNKEKSNE
jgi:hypothetical protein